MVPTRATIQVPSENDGMSKNGSRANWGVLVSAGTANNVATLVVTPKNCTTLTYTGATSAPVGTNAAVAAQITDPTGSSVAGRTINFALGGGGSISAVTNAAGVAAINLPVNSPPRTTTITASYAGTATNEAANVVTPFTVGQVATTTSVVANPPIVTIGDPTVFTATVTPASGGNPPGSVQFKVNGADFGAPVPLSGGTASSANYVGPLGFHNVVAVYLGSTDYAGSESEPYTFRIRNPLLNTTTASSVSPGLGGLRPAGHPVRGRDQCRLGCDWIGDVHVRLHRARDHRHQQRRPRRDHRQRHSGRRAPGGGDVLR